MQEINESTEKDRNEKLSSVLKEKRAVLRAKKSFDLYIYRKRLKLMKNINEKLGSILKEKFEKESCLEIVACSRTVKNGIIDRFRMSTGKVMSFDELVRAWDNNVEIRVKSSVEGIPSRKVSLIMRKFFRTHADSYTENNLQAVEVDMI